MLNSIITILKWYFLLIQYFYYDLYSPLILSILSLLHLIQHDLIQQQ